MIALSPEAEAQLDALIIEGNYWISYSLAAPPIISGVFYAMSDIPNRFRN